MDPHSYYDRPDWEDLKPGWNLYRVGSSETWNNLTHWSRTVAIYFQAPGGA